MSNFVDLYLKHTSEYESPTSFWKWSAFTTISATLRDNCFRQFGDIRIFPNIYVLLLADSAVHRKGNPVKLCESLIKSVKNTKLISGRSSIQAILVELARGETDKESGKLLKGGSSLFSASELSASLVADPQAVQILTDIYDFHEEYVSRLKGSGTFRVNNVCFSMMAASNEELLKTIYDAGAIFGGLLGRTFLVKPNEFRPGNSLFTIEDKSKSFKELVEKLEEMAKLRGMFEFTEEAQREYDLWYKPFRDGYKDKSDKSGISGRIHTGVIKLAMCLCVNYSTGLLIAKTHVEEAITECMNLMQNYQSFVMSSGKSTIAEIGAVFLEEIYSKESTTISRKEILSKHWQKFDMESFDKCVQHMEAAGMILMFPNGSDVTYGMTAKCKTMLFENKGKEKKNA